MTEAISLEAIRAVGGPTGAGSPINLQPSDLQPSTAAVERFQAAMAVDGPRAADPIPFASEATAAWRSAQINNQGILHRVRALSELSARGTLSAPEMLELQYEVMNLSFQQEVVTKVADKSSNAIQTLIKNQ